MNPTPAALYPSVFDVERIAALTDPVLRNLLITQTYHELALAVAARTGPCANWCTFAVWASKQAGQTIRREDFPRLLQSILDSTFSAQAAPELTVAAQTLGSDCPPDEVQETVADLLNPLGAFLRASDAVARGNRKVFAEIGREFARFLTALGDIEPVPLATLDSFLAGLRPGDPPDGQRLLRQAFTRMARAIEETDPKTKVELLLCANAEIGLHEQTRLQPEIAEAMNAGLLSPREFRGRLIDVLFPRRRWSARWRLFWHRLLGRPHPFDLIVERLFEEARRRARLAVTEAMMTLGGPGGLRLRLGDDVPAPFPASLKQIMLPDLRALLAQYDPTPDSPRDSGALDWASLPDRLHFILDLFRTYEESTDWFEPPFTAEQTEALKAGHVPDGPL
jgi:hypothetical protein